MENEVLIRPSMHVEFFNGSDTDESNHFDHILGNANSIELSNLSESSNFSFFYEEESLHQHWYSENDIDSLLVLLKIQGLAKNEFFDSIRNSNDFSFVKIKNLDDDYKQETFFSILFEYLNPMACDFNKVDSAFSLLNIFKESQNYVLKKDLFNYINFNFSLISKFLKNYEMFVTIF